MGCPIRRRRSSRRPTTWPSACSTPPTASAWPSPPQVSVVGFDDIPLAAFTAPPLTTVHNPIAEMAALAVDIAIDRPAGTRARRPTTSWLPGFTVRATTAPRPVHDGPTATSSASTSARCRGARWSSGSTTAPRWARAVHEYRHGVIERAPRRRRPTRPALPPDWALQVPHDYVDVLQNAVPAAVRAQRRRPGRRDRHRHRLHRLHGAAGARRRHAAVRAARARRPPARLRQALEAPRGAAPRRSDQRPRRRARRAVAAPLRRQDLVRVGVRQGAAAPRGGPRDLPAARITGSRPPTGSSGGCAASTSATPAPPATRRSSRTAPTRRATTSPRSTPASPTS